MQPKLNVTYRSGHNGTFDAPGDTGSQVLANAKRFVEQLDGPDDPVVDWTVTVNGRVVFSKTIEDARADDMLRLAAQL